MIESRATCTAAFALLAALPLSAAAVDEFSDGARQIPAEELKVGEMGKLCSTFRPNPTTCFDVRLHDDMVHLRRVSGEVIRYVPR